MLLISYCKGCMTKNRGGHRFEIFLLVAISELVDAVWFYVDPLWEQDMYLVYPRENIQLISTVLVRAMLGIII